MEGGVRRGLLLGCLFVSGFTGLAYEILWMRWFGLVFGNMAVSVSAILSAFFLGLAAGSHFAGHHANRIERPLRVYAGLEALIGLFGLGSYALIKSLAVLETALGDAAASSLTAIRFGAALVVLFLPTFAMGATLPVFLRGIAGDGAHLSQRTAEVYGINTCGAVFGAYVTSYWLLPHLGAFNSLLLTVALNLTLALAIRLGFGKDRVPAAAAPREEASRTLDGAVVLPLVLAGLTGLAALVLEVVLTRLLSLVLEGTIYSFGAVLATFLAGIGLGSLAIRRHLDRLRDSPREGFALYARLLLTLFASVALPLLALPWLHFGLAWIWWSGASGIVQIHAKLILCVLVLLPMAIAFGAALPLLVALYKGARHQGVTGAAEGLGRLYAVNTVGGVIGAAGAGLVLVPVFGTDGTLLIVLALIAAQAAVVAIAGDRRRLALAALGLWIVFAVTWPGTPIAAMMRNHGQKDYGAFRQSSETVAEQTLYFAQGQTSDVAVFASPEGWSLNINGLPQAGGGAEPPIYGAESLILALLPYALHPEPASALVVGYGGGITTEVLIRSEHTQRIRVVEIEPRVLDAVEAVHGDGNAPHQHPRVEVAVADARNLLLRDPELFDLVLCHVTDPWLSGAAGISTREFFELVHGRLAPGGVFMIWLGGWGETHARSVAGALSQVFDDQLLVTVDYATYLVASNAPLQIDPASMASRLEEPGLQFLIAPLWLNRLENVLHLIIGGGSATTTEVPANTDDNAYVEVFLPLVRHRGNQPVADLPGPVLSEAALTSARFSEEGEEWILRLSERELGTPEGVIPPSADFSRLARLRRRYRAAAIIESNQGTLPADVAGYLAGRLALAQGRPEEAAATLASVPESSMVHRRARRYLAAAHVLAGDRDRALAVAQELWEVGDADGTYLYGLLTATSNPEDSRRALEQSRPWRPEAAVPLARAARRDGDHDLGRFREDLSKTLAIDGDNHQAHDLLASIALEEGDEVAAWGHRTLAVEAARRKAARLLEIAEIHVAAGRPEPAAETLRAALTLNPTPADVWSRLLTNLVAAGDVAGAEQALSEALRLSGDPAKVQREWRRISR